ncbi:cytochrome b [Phenylobacterium sp.]|jgi:cytochrome b561|uniref:cytochrome b n=1 Tax=Phenylobacterium sp. TaxID=1871053 RepID=UPI002E326CC1|nr:cytochrome b [Phenylobacterium sp.]HEX3363669.1 cytochrome b [Phenylobacterium sp.]
MNDLAWSKPASQPKTAAPLLRFDPVSIALHWATVLLLTVMFASIWGRGFLGEDTPAGSGLLTLHRSAGVTLWLVAIGRLVWRLTFGLRPSLPPSVSPLQARAAALTEGGLYILLLVQPLTGLLQTLARGRPFELFMFEIPQAMARDKGLAMLFHQVHELAAWLLLGLVGLHVGAALLHGVVLKDGVLQTMLPRRRPEGAARRRAAP